MCDATAVRPEYSSLFVICVVTRLSQDETCCSHSFKKTFFEIESNNSSWRLKIVPKKKDTVSKLI